LGEELAMSDAAGNSFTTQEGQVDAPDSAAPTGDYSKENWAKRFEEQDRTNESTQGADEGGQTEGSEEAAQEATDKAIAKLFKIKWNDGKEYELPEVFKEPLSKFESLDKDYTSKYQRLADERREVEAKLREDYQQNVRMKQHAKEYARAEVLSTQLSQYADIDWQAWALQDPNAAARHQVIRNELAREAGEIQERVSSFEQEQSESAKNSRVTTIIKAQEQIKSEIPEWGPDLAKKVTRHCLTTLKLPMEVLNEANLYPGVMKALYTSMMQEESMSKAMPSKIKSITPQPVPKVGGSAEAAKTTDQLSTRDWMRERYKQLEKANAAGGRYR